ncbi:MAG: hypothetical protein OXH50_05015 [Gemmatimonadetes bacterium]|nr:hypothetical protein [Gemmatimonadota bacterium]
MNATLRSFAMDDSKIGGGIAVCNHCRRAAKGTTVELFQDNIPIWTDNQVS